MLRSPCAGGRLRAPRHSQCNRWGVTTPVLLRLGVSHLAGSSVVRGMAHGSAPWLAQAQIRGFDEAGLGR